MERAILHCDMNNFFASVECLLDENLKDKPVAVCGDVKERRGIVVAKNYIAKPYGINVGDPVWMAKKKCPELVVVSTPHYDQYEKYSNLAREIYKNYTDQVEPFGMDECWLDVTKSKLLYGDAKFIADTIRERIKKELGLTISVGVSFNKVFAKLGSDMKKPDATTIITSKNFKEVVWPLPVSDLLGVGRQTKKVLDKNFIYTIGDLANEREDMLKYWLGSMGLTLHRYANGEDDDPVAIYEDIDLVKSVSHGITTVRDLESNEEVWKVIFELTQEIAYKLRQKNLRAKGVSISIRDNELYWQQFQKKFAQSEQSAINIAKEAYDLFVKRYDWDKLVRNVTVTAINLVDDGTPEQISLFDDKVRKEKIEKAEECMENINKKYGEGKVLNATLMNDEILPSQRRKLRYGDGNKRKDKNIN